MVRRHTAPLRPVRINAVAGQVSSNKQRVPKTLLGTCWQVIDSMRTRQGQWSVPKTSGFDALTRQRIIAISERFLRILAKDAA
jgi:hypothetical protein